MNAIIACGGTGGHLFPGIAVAEVLRQRGHEVLLFVSEKEIDSLALSTRSQFKFEKLPVVGFPSVYSPRIFGFIKRFTESLSLCRSIYQKFKPQVVLGPMPGALRSGHGFGHLFDDRDERIPVLAFGIADWFRRFHELVLPGTGKLNAEFRTFGFPLCEAFAGPGQRLPRRPRE